MINGLSIEKLYCAHRITTEFHVRDLLEPKKTTGTGFFVRNAAGAQCFVTNRHMLEIGYKDPDPKYIGAHLASVRIEGFSRQDGNVHALPDRTVDFSITAPKEYRVPADRFEDVVCFESPKIMASGLGATIAYFIDSKDLADDDWIESRLSICDFVAFPGYPEWHDKLEGRPIIRTGTISSDPRTNYSERAEFMGRRIVFEAFSTSGASGSPVFATEKGILAKPPLTITGYREAKVIGINAGHLEGPYSAHSGLSYFIKSSAILEVIGDTKPAP